MGIEIHKLSCEEFDLTEDDAKFIVKAFAKAGVKIAPQVVVDLPRHVIIGKVLSGAEVISMCMSSSMADDAAMEYIVVLPLVDVLKNTDVLHAIQEKEDGHLQ